MWRAYLACFTLLLVLAGCAVAATSPRPTAAGDSPPVAWRSTTLDGDVYARPLVAGGLVYAATQANTLYALDEASGRVVWQTTVGPPVPRSALPCGNLKRTGILSTPVLDPRTNRLYAIAFLAPGRHAFVALDARYGRILIRQPADPPGADPLVEQQRAALAYADGRVYAAYGGLFGDCGAYHGWVVAIDPSSGRLTAEYQVPTRREGGIWAPSGPLVSPNGDLYVATGNGDSQQDFDYGNSVLRLSPDLRLRDWFAPADWAALNAADADLGSTGPTAVGDSLIFQVGKSGRGYLLRADHLGGIGGAAYSRPVCGAAFGGTLYQAPLLYVPCVEGMVALRVDSSAPAFSTAWQTAANFPGPPVLARGLLWTITRDGDLLGLDPANGHGRVRAGLGSVTHFATPAAADGYLFAPAARQILAFDLGR